MLTTISAEFIKLKRSRILWFIVLGGLFPPIIKAIQYANPKTLIGNGEWSGFLSNYQEINMFITLNVMIIASSFIFSMEHQYNTASYIFTTTTPRSQIYVAKVLSLLLQLSTAAFTFENSLNIHDYSITEQGIIRVYDRVDEAASINQVLNKQGILVHGVNVKTDTLEDYF